MGCAPGRGGLRVAVEGAPLPASCQRGPLCPAPLALWVQRSQERTSGRYAQHPLCTRLGASRHRGHFELELRWNPAHRSVAQPGASPGGLGEAGSGQGGLEGRGCGGSECLRPVPGDGLRAQRGAHIWKVSGLRPRPRPGQPEGHACAPAAVQTPVRFPLRQGPFVSFPSVPGLPGPQPKQLPAASV